ncbi:ABC transporter ATP-binding protein [Ferrimonas balearica]|uniref:ABC transporter ATP-binding protein n=1 Tax=Ferrimonas balearica TaxID=44012 RepID=UPI001F15F119|nr:ABC transporter ATP-binding protein [Ferrimonas balearica]MBY6017203.1 ABC transporter ATP-binding protein [Halomonas denitrificans]MBY6093479.1 ABC transporter ATP-binding protein [Ferrimonas balearica]
MHQLEIHNLHYRWPGSGRQLRLPKLTLEAGERAMLRGVSGSGKSTLLNLIAGVLRPDDGTLQLTGVELTQLSAGKRDRLRAESMGIVFQQFNLLPYLSVHDNIVLPLKFAPQRRQRVSEPEAEVSRLMDAMELPQSVLGRPVTELSVGQQQRVAVARALIGSPALILADEPTSALDPDSRDRFMALLTAQCQAAGSSLLLVSHDPALAECVDTQYQLRVDEQGTEVLRC